MSVNIKIENAQKRYGDNIIIENLSLDIKQGEFFTLLGPSGCGKTTLLRMIAGFNSIENGNFYFNEKRINDLDPAKRNIGMVFQNYAIFPHLTVEQNVEFGLKNRKVSKEEMKAETEKFLKLMQIDEYRDRMPERLSGGQQQRVALGRALVAQPEILLLDEPLSNLDAKLRVDMRNEIRRIQQEAGITAIYVTHDQSEAMALSDNIIIMKKGVVDQVGDPQTVYYHPADEFVADFIGESNFLHAAIADKLDSETALCRFEGHEFEVSGCSHLDKGKECCIVLRPESARLADEGTLACEVVLSRFMGHYQNYHVMVGDTLIKITDFNPRMHKIYNVGDHAFVDFTKDEVHVL